MTGYTLKHFLDDFRYALPSTWYSSSTVFTPILERFPTQLTTEVVFENRLATDNPQVDLSISIEHSNRQDFATLVNAQFGDQWSLLRAFTTRWARSDSSFSHQIGKIWLTFDGVESRAAVPSLYLGANFTNPIQPEELRWRQYPEWLLTEAIPFFWDQAASPEMANCLTTCLNALPDTMFLPMIGLMLARGEKFMRLLLPDFPLDKLVPYLETIQWAGSLRDIESWLACYGPMFKSVTVQLDLADQALPQLCLEGYQEPSLLKIASRWEAVFARLIADNLCSQEKMQQVFSFLGASKAQLPFREGSTLVGRTIRHIKFVYKRNMPPEVKAYPAFVLIPLD